MTDRQLLTVQQVADHAQLSKASVYRAIHAGQLPALRFRRTIRVRLEDVAAWEDRNRIEPAPVAVLPDRPTARPRMSLVAPVTADNVMDRVRAATKGRVA